jgi:hypothetical protein
MTTKFIVLDSSGCPYKEVVAVEFEDYTRLLKYLTDYGSKYKKVYRIEREMTTQFNCSLAEGN